jgi:hypothetical protein
LLVGEELFSPFLGGTDFVFEVNVVEGLGELCELTFGVKTLVGAEVAVPDFTFFTILS